jgi:hypothetical protein
VRVSRRRLLRLLTVSLSGFAVGGLAGCGPLAPPVSTPEPARPDSTPAFAQAPSGAPGADATAGAAQPHPATPATSQTANLAPAVTITPGPVLTVAVPPPPPQLPPTPVPTATPRPRPTRAMVTVPYYSQLIGRQNYCLPTSIAMIADRYNMLPGDVSGTPDRAPKFVADVAYRLARERIGALNQAAFTTLWEEIGTDPLGGLIWDVFTANGRDLAAGMSPALAYLVLGYAFDLRPVLGTLDECLVALEDDLPSILFGSYGVLRRADGMAGNVGGYAGDHAFVLVGIDYERVIVNDPLPTDKQRYSGERGTSSASTRAVRFELASVRRMTRGDGGQPRGDCFMVPPPGQA